MKKNSGRNANMAKKQAKSRYLAGKHKKHMWVPDYNEPMDLTHSILMLTGIHMGRK